MQFVKMHGLGNDFIIIDNTNETFDLKKASRLANRRTGIGADVILLYEKSAVADAKMRVINADGTEAEMCGNGIRCFAKYLADESIISSSTAKIETLGGIQRIEILENTKQKAMVKVLLATPAFNKSDIPMLGEGLCIEEKIMLNQSEHIFSAVRVGIPHAVVLVENISTTPWRVLGKELVTHHLFPEQVNTNFVQIISENKIAMRSYERGVGATLACGTGAAAAVVCLCKAGRTNASVEVELELGSLFIAWQNDGSVEMTGPAEISYWGACGFDIIQ